ncbi:coiled-coil-helix-coiled-coil-helix domain-containing protein 5 isoform X1 [Symphalangus syndactylus]|uniref:coiled-coil-helix-coiled-coil-helix domain-containing protein 5 isoform X1 n=1 Tax=Symphalangus syndactylus TaxID=9590 RepID=UPI00244225CC|nr:coiled-coil-helix-coiled-coil-helix domain-containing protein 5 isoform X2 [Symphalangus syndactylus]
MQAALEVTARYCGRELEQYGQCVAAKPESWQRDCHYLKMSIAQCTSSHPIIRQIRQACAQPFEAFEECLRQNEAAVGNCAEHMRRFLQCAEQVQLPRSPTTVEVRGAHLSSSLFSITSPSFFWLFRVKTLESSSAPPHHHTGLCHASRIQNIITSCPI